MGWGYVLLLLLFTWFKILLQAGSWITMVFEIRLSKLKKNFEN